MAMLEGTHYSNDHLSNDHSDHLVAMDIKKTSWQWTAGQAMKNGLAASPGLVLYAAGSPISQQHGEVWIWFWI